MATVVTEPGAIDPHAPSGFGDDDAVYQNQTDGLIATLAKKKKKKKPKKSKPSPLVIPATPATATPEAKQAVLCISRNKHWRYISSYHGPWLQLPIELLESLLVLNLDPTNFTPKDERLPPMPTNKRTTSPSRALTLRRPNSKPTPPPIDPGVFRSVTNIRRLIDEASDLAVRAASGLSATALGALRSPGGGNNPWSTAQALGMNPMGDQHGGRGTSMSATRTHRLRVLAVQKLAAAYKADEIAASVMVMQGASALDDLAERVLKVDPNDLDAKYVHFFHEKIPSSPRQLAEHTTTQTLDKLIDEQPTRLHYFRTRGTVHCFRDEYALAIKDFTHVFKESKALRKARNSHHLDETRRPKTKGKQHRAEHKTNGQAPPSGTSVPEDASPVNGGNPQQLHSSVGPDAPEPLEPQVLFLRAAAYLQNAVFLIEEAVLEVEGVKRVPAQDALELRHSLLEKGKYGGVSWNGSDGPLGPKAGAKMQAYRKLLASLPSRDIIAGLLKKSIRDHEKFMTYFDTVDGTLPTFEGNVAQRIEAAFLLAESLRPGSQSSPPPLPENPGIFTTYHPLLVESHFSVLICQLLLGDFVSVLPAYQRAASLVDGLEGYPVFLPARSMAQAEFMEILERIASTWAPGTLPHSLAVPKTLRIEAAPVTPSPISSITESQFESLNSTRTTSPITEYDALSDFSSERSKSSFALSRLSSKVSDTVQLKSNGRRHSTDDSELLERGFPGHGSHGNRVNLDCLRILLAPVVNRQRVRKGETGKTSNGKGAANNQKTLSVNIPLHGPRVDLALAYIAAVHLPELDE